MRKKKTYLDTSVVSYLRQEDAPEQVRDTVDSGEVGVIQMNDSISNQSFNVDDIRRVRNEASIRYEGKTYEEISNEISRGAQVGYQILDRIRRENAERQDI